MRDDIATITLDEQRSNNQETPLTSEAAQSLGLSKHPLATSTGTPCRYSIGC